MFSLFGIVRILEDCFEQLSTMWKGVCSNLETVERSRAKKLCFAEKREGMVTRRDRARKYSIFACSD